MWPTDQNRRAWEQRYGHPAAAGDRLPEAVRQRLPDLTGVHVLHLLCGAGEATADLIALHALVTGVDPREHALAAARERAPDAALFQAEAYELPLQLRRGRFVLAYAGEGTLAGVPDLEPFFAGVASALRKGGQLLLYDWHPVAACVEPIALRWRGSYFADELWRLGQVAVAVGRSGLALQELDELPPPRSETGGRLDPRLPTHLLLRATKVEAAPAASGRRRG